MWNMQVETLSKPPSAMAASQSALAELCLFISPSIASSEIISFSPSEQSR